MPLFRCYCLFLLSVMAASALAACSGEAPPNDASAGSLLLSLELAGEAGIDKVRWAIHGGDMEPMEGVIDTSAPGATPSVGECYGRPGSRATAAARLPRPIAQPMFSR